jgi:Arc/MetJ-type ribon-helix-helix transcriptional regulator
LQRISVYLPESYLDNLEDLVKAKMYPNRSEAIRTAVRDLLKEQLWNKKTVSTIRPQGAHQ